MKISPIEAEMFHVDRWTDMTNPIFVFRILRRRLKTKEYQCLCSCTKMYPNANKSLP